MLLQEKIENDMRLAMHGKERKTQILKFIVSEFQRRPNLKVSLTDDQVISIIRKFITSTEETAKIVGSMTDEQKFEIDVLSEYLPQMASEDEIRDWISKNVKDIPEDSQKRMRCMGSIMKHFGSTADGNTVKRILLSM